jgi:hypothetical protein
MMRFLTSQSFRLGWLTGVFCIFLGRRVGHPFRLVQIDRVTFLPAMVASFGGDNRLLVNELRKLLA